ncbi:MAG: hypothetical protein IMZ60_03835 [Actinobacteria bacterium]|nr:hypothetical protein [Actinomycetota bacterium]
MTKFNTEESEKKFNEKYEFFSCNLDSGMSNGVYKNWEVTFLLLTKKEKEELIRETYKRMKLYNKKYKPKDWAGYNNERGEEI